MKKFLFLIALAALAAFPIIFKSSPASAATSGTVDISMAAGCVSYVDGQTGNSYLDVPSGGDVNLTVNNNDNWIVQNITGGSINTSVNYNSKSTNNQTVITLSQVYRPVTLTFTPVPKNSDGITPTTCPIGSSPVVSSITINPATASLSCTLSGSQWILGGSFSGNSLGTGIYSGSILITSISPATISKALSAGSSSQAFSIIDGTNYSGKGTTLASSTCPAYVASTSLSSSSKINTPSSSTPSTTSTANTSSIESVKLSSAKVNGTDLDTSKSVQVDEGQPLTISGTTVPFGVVTLTIHSTPRTVSTTADKNGLWSYAITGLSTGNHTVQASVKDPSTGKSSQTAQILVFTIKPVAALLSHKSSRSYLLIIVLTVIILASSLVVWHFRHKKKAQSQPTNIPPVSPVIPPTSQ